MEVRIKDEEGKSFIVNMDYSNTVYCNDTAVNKADFGKLCSACLLIINNEKNKQQPINTIKENIQ